MHIKNIIKHKCGRYPSLFFPLYRTLAPRLHIQECLLSPDKELVIEGFPRSANTYAVVAFRLAQRRQVPCGHHLHVEAQVLRCVNLGKPVIVLVRNPDDAIKSLLIRHPEVVPGWAYERWFEFYSSISKFNDKIIWGGFEDVTKDFGNVIKRVNDKYGTKYRIFDSTEANVKEVYRRIEEINRMVSGGKESHVARPSETRRTVSVEIPTCKERSKAIALYRELKVDLHRG